MLTTRNRPIVNEVAGTVLPLAAEADANQLRRTNASTRIGDLTEYGRVVHAEVEALSACVRIGASPKPGALCTSAFPCHNRTKHIVAIRISRVVYVKPYPKSKAFHLHFDSIAADGVAGHDGKVLFVPSHRDSASVGSQDPGDTLGLVRAMIRS